MTVVLAKECAVHVRTVQRWLAGQSVRTDEAERVAAALNLGRITAVTTRENGHLASRDPPGYRLNGEDPIGAVGWRSPGACGSARPSTNGTATTSRACSRG